MKYILLIFMLLPISLLAQDTVYKKYPNSGKTETFINVENLAEPQYDVIKYIADNVKFPVRNSDKSQIAKVVVLFIVDAEGYIMNPKVVKSYNATLDTEAIRVIKSMPKWHPAIANGKTVPCYYSLPVIMQKPS